MYSGLMSTRTFGGAVRLSQRPSRIRGGQIKPRPARIPQSSTCTSIDGEDDHSLREGVVKRSS
jgi:hypothetical protein